MLKRKFDYSSRFRILKGGKISLVVSALLGSVTLSYSAPTGGTVTSGNATISQNGTVTNINQSSSKASINWNNFSIGSNESVNFNQPNSSSITLNRVIGNEKSVIEGAMNANGQVWLLNSNGILFSKNASINTSGLLATTGELSDSDFQNGNYNFKNSSSNSVINLGTIKVENSSYVVLAGKEVQNGGRIEALKGKVHLVGANEYSINLNGNSLVNLRVNKGVLDAMVSNSGTILANGGEVFLTTNAVDELLKGVVNNDGIIEANSADDLFGKVELFAHGGTTEVSGEIKAEGGFVETSGKELNVSNETIIKANKWLIDPTDVTIDGGTGAIGNSSVGASVIASSLNSGTSVDIQATNDITVNSAISKTAGADATLTLEAGRHININADITSTSGALNTVFLADTDKSGDGINTVTALNITTNGGSVTFGNGNTHAIGGYLVGGDVYFNSSSAQTISTSGGDITIHGETLIANTAGLTLDTGTNGGNVTFDGVVNSANQYDMISTAKNAITWDDARTAAINGTGGGSATGDSYLVNISSRLENAVAGIASGYVGAWLGATRDGNGLWIWADGPESGVAFFQQTANLGSGGTTESGMYSNWSPGQPDNWASLNEAYAQFSGNIGQWNDLPNSVPNNPDEFSIFGYVKETNLANSSLTINTGSGNVTFSEDVGTSKAINTLTVTANEVNIPSAITTSDLQTYNGLLKLESDATLTTISNDIKINNGVSKTAGSDATLTFKAARNIEINADISSILNKLNLDILADNDYSGDGIVKLTSNLSSNGGNINFGDGTYFDSQSSSPTDANDYLVGGDVYISSSSAQTINSNGGNITVNGEMLIANSSASGVTFNSNGGNVDFKGVVNSGNSYESVSYTGTWNDAKTNATSGTGSAIGDTYLATITSRLENIIAGQAVGYNTSWLGAKRTDSTGEWRWVTGTEGLQNNGAGLLFFTQTGGGTGTTTSGLYSNWNGGEPNGSLSTNNETALQFVGTQGLWNDLPYNSTTLDYYVKETNLSNSKLTINAGSGNVTFGEDVGTSKAIDTLNVTANQTKLPSAITTSNTQNYDGGAVKLVYDTVLTTTNSDIKFDSTVDSFDALSPKNLTTNILADSTYYWINWTSADATHVYGTITVGGKTIDVTYTNPNGFFGAQTTDGSGTNYWTSTNSISPYTSTNVANGPSTTDIVQLNKEATQTLTFSESIENLAFSVVSMNGNGFWFDQDFNIESYTGYNGAGAGYYGTGTLVKVVEDGYYKLNDAQLTSPSEPHGTIRFNNSFSELTWNSHYENGWYGFTIGTSGASADAGKVIFNSAVGGIVKLNDIDINAAMQTTADITSANSLDVSGFSNIGGNITTTANQNFQSAINLTSDATLTTTTNGNVSTNATIDGAHNLTINTNGTGDTTISGAIGATTKLKNLSITTDVVNLNGINVEDNSNITIANRSESTILDIISGTGVTFTKDETGTLILTAENTFDGVTTISDGTLQLGNGGATGWVSSSSIVNNSNLVYNRSDETQYGGIISGTGNLEKKGTGTLILTKDNTYTGSTTITEGTLQLGNGGTEGSISDTSNVVNNGTLKYNKASDTVANYLISGSGNVEIVGTSSLFFGDIDNTNNIGFITTTAQVIATNTTVQDVLEKLAGGRMNGGAIGGILEAGVYNKDFTDGTFQVMMYSNGGTNNQWTKVVFVKLEQNGNNVTARAYEGRPDTNPGVYAVYASGDVRGVDYRTASISGTMPLAITGDSTSSDYSGYGVDQLFTSSKVTFTKDNTYTGTTTLNTTVFSNDGGGTTAQGSYYERKALAILQLGQNGTSGNIEDSSSIVNNGVLIFNRSDDLTTTGNISGTGKITKLNNNTVTLSGLHSYTGSTLIDDGTLKIQNDAPTTASSIFDGDGKLIIESASDSFTSSFSNSGWTLSNTLTGFTIGKSANTADITLANAIDINGYINVYGGNINVNANLDTQGGATSGDILLKASGDITQTASISVTTDGGDVIYWSNSDNGTNLDGGILLRKNSSITTNGGNLWLGGGSSSTIWNGLIVGNGYALGGTTITPSNGGSDINAGIYFEDALVNTSNGNIAMYGQGTTARGITTYGSLSVNSGSGKILIDAKSEDGYALMMGVHNSIYASNQSFTSTNSSSDAIVVNAISDTSRGTTVEGNISFNATNDGGISFTSLGSNVSGSLESIRLGYSSTSNGVLNLLGNSGDITLNTGAKGINIQSAGSIYMGRKTGSSVTTSASNITYIGDDFTANGPFNFNTSGILTIKPQDGNSFANTVDTTNINYSSDVSGLTIGHADNTGNIKIGSATTIAGAINLFGGDIAIDNKLEATGTNTIKLQASGTVTDGASGYVVADKLALKGSGAFTLDNVLNNVTTLAAGNDDTSAVGAITFVNADGLIIGTVNPTGITSNGIINISTLTGNLEVTENISTTDTSSSAITLNAGKNTAAGTSTGGDIILSQGKTISVGNGGRAVLYTGSLNGSTGIADLVGYGSGNFRYNADETTDFTDSNTWTNLETSGTYGIYREQPSASGTISSETITYGDNNPSFSMSGAVLVNGDDSAGFTIDGATYSAINKLDAGSYAVTASGLAKLGYNVGSVTNGTLTVNKAALTVTANDDAKFVTQSDASNFAGVSYSGFVGGETNSVLGGTLAISRSNSGTETANTYTDVLVASGLSSSNYSFNYVNGDFTIVPAGELLVRVTDVIDTYGTATAYSIFKSSYWDTTANAGAGGEIVLAAATDNSNNNFTVNDGASGSATFTVTPLSGSYSTANKLSVGTYQLGYTGLNTVNGANFNNTVHMIGSHQVNQQGLTATASGVTKVYDKTYDMTGVTLGLDTPETNDVVTVSGTGAFSSKNAGSNLSYTISNLSLNGTDAANYYISGGSTLVGNDGEITKKVVDLSVSKTYDGNADFTTGYVLNTNDIINGDIVNASGTATVSSANANTYTSFDSNSLSLDNNNYTLSGNTIDAKINKADATVTAGSSTVTYNGTAQTVSGFSATGLVNGETTSVLTGVTGASATGTNAGTYNTSLAGTDGNYNLTFVNGELVINKANATVTADSSTVTYNGQTQSVNTFTASGLVNGEAISVLDGVSVSGNGKNVGTYTTTASGTDENYNLSFVNGTLTINPKTITVSANNLSKIFGSNDPVLTYIANGIIGNDVLEGLLSRESGENSGEYTISKGSLANPNYSITFNNGIFTIQRDNNLDNVITSIANTTVIKTPKIDVVVPQQVVVPTPVNTIVTPDGTQTTTVKVISKPLEAQPTKMVSMSEIKTSNASNDNGSTAGVNTDVRVPLSANSQIQLVNGGVNLPNGLEQQFFVVDNGNN